jgi:muramoyltetrapeptide carboxypeptidase
MITKPHALQKGDKVAVIAPSSAADKEVVKNAQRRVYALGLTPVMYPTCYTKYGHLSARDDERAKDVNDAFSNEDIKGIICLRGGYGTPRILELLDYEMIKLNPKVFVGYSDITALHIAFNKICRMVTYHGPMATSSYETATDSEVQFEEYTYQSLSKNIFTSQPIGVYQNPKNEELETLLGGKCQGEIVGGNLSLLVSTLGSPYEVDARGKILFIEDVGEPVYRIDRMLTSLSLAGKFNDCNGLILGTWSNCIREKKSYEEGYDLPLDEVFENTLKKFNKPIISNFRAGHNFPQPTIPFGTHVEMDADERKIIFTESGNID